RLAEEKPVTVDWSSECKVDPFTTSLEQNLALLTKCDEELRTVKGVTLAETNFTLRRHEQRFYSSEGSDIHQTRFTTGAGYVAHAFAGSEIQKRSYPNSFGGQYQNRGYELIDELKLVESARRIGEEAVALHSADQCPEGVLDIILDSSQLGLQIHESVGHPIELDRVLGMEANFAGTSFLTTEKLLSLEQLVSDTDHGIYMETNRSWSIDDKRYNFQFGCEVGYEIKNGKRVRMLKNPSYSGITTDFWNSMDAICSRDHWTL